MIRPKLSLRRPLAVAGAALVGLTAVVAIAAPASAHHSVVSGQFKCDTATGEFVGKWTVDSVAIPGVNKYKLTTVDAKSFVGRKATDATVPGIAVWTGEGYPHTTGSPLVGELRVPGDTTKVSLSVMSQWENRHQETQAKGAIVRLGGKCTKPAPSPAPKTPKPSASVEPQCDGSAIVKLQNGADATAAAEFTLTAGASKTYTVEAGKTETVTVTAANAANIKVTAKGMDKALIEGPAGEAANCVKPDEATGVFEATCDEFIFTIENPKGGETVNATFTPNKGDAQKLTVAPGETKSVKFKGEKGLTVTPSAEGLDDSEPIAWDTEKPKDCPVAGGNGGGDSLPVTGAAAGTIAGGAALLLIIGGVLFFIARRRKVTFTA
ncbi:LPXTG cell wall anchor domain-containing protein [Micromonospora sp. NPDC049679]|uniref:LPXTG cell wall anchor domain-containing protein n=1 Tax=Micromonospora sp. NPDC049679 TaxID=3155920 RepID=UPI0033EA7078